jgi:hypothetical protein
MNRNDEDTPRRTRSPKRWVVSYKKQLEDKKSYLHVVSATNEEEAWETTKKKLKLDAGALLVYIKCTT